MPAFICTTPNTHKEPFIKDIRSQGWVC